MQVFSVSSQLVLYLILYDRRIMAWPTLKASIHNYTYEILEPSYMRFNITSNGSNGHTFYWNIMKSNWKMWVQVLLNFVEDDGRFVTFTNKTVSVCKLLNTSRYEPLIKTFYEVLYEISPTLVRRCPIQKKLYYLPVINFETNKVPPIWPETKVYLKVLYLSKEHESFKEIVSLTINGKIMKK